MKRKKPLTEEQMLQIERVHFLLSQISRERHLAERANPQPRIDGKERR